VTHTNTLAYFSDAKIKKSFSTLTKDESSTENINSLSEDKSEPILVPGPNRIKHFHVIHAPLE
jgi:hypothetical protein